MKSWRAAALPVFLSGLLFIILSGNQPSSLPAAALPSPRSSVPALQTDAALSLPASSSSRIVSASSSRASAEAPASACVPAGAKADPSFLDGAVFIGDSVTLKLKNYVTLKRKSDPGFFGTAAFLAAGSMGSGNALKPLAEDSIHPLYNGRKALLEDNAAQMGANKIYFMLGINDIAPYGVNGAAENLEALVLRFPSEIPNARIYIQSATPILANKQGKALNNQNLERYNKLLSATCQKHGWYFLDVASVMRDGTGALKAEYCSDPGDLGLHFTDEACGVWVRYILTHTGG